MFVQTGISVSRCVVLFLIAILSTNTLLKPSGQSAKRMRVGRKRDDERSKYNYKRPKARKEGEAKSRRKKKKNIRRRNIPDDEDDFVDLCPCCNLPLNALCPDCHQPFNDSCECTSNDESEDEWEDSDEEEIVEEEHELIEKEKLEVPADHSD